MEKRAYCGKRTKIYVPKVVTPQILTYQGVSNAVKKVEAVTNMVSDEKKQQ